MKKLHVLGLAVSAALSLPLAAQASDGTITFVGGLNASTCTVTTGTTGNFTVNLPILAAASLPTAGSTAGETPFSIAIGGCTGGETTFTPYFEAGGTTDVATGRLNTNPGPNHALNVQLQLLQLQNGNNSVINLAGAAGAQGVTPAAITGTPGTGVGFYAVRYYATGAATAGTVSSQVTYSMVYL